MVDGTIKQLTEPVTVVTEPVTVVTEPIVNGRPLMVDQLGSTILEKIGSGKTDFGKNRFWENRFWETISLGKKHWKTSVWENLFWKQSHLEAICLVEHSH